MRFKATTWILVATLAGVAAYYFFVEERSRAAKERSRLESTKLFLYEMKDLAGFTLINPQKERIEIEHDGDDWRIVSPVSSPGDVPTITAFIGQVVPGRRSSKIDKPGNPADYGLVDPFATLIVRRTGAAAPETLFVGDKTPTSSNSYVRIGAAGPVLISSEITHNVMNKNLFHLRDKNFLPGGLGAVDSLAISRGSRTLRLVKNDGYWWFAGRRIRADRMRIEPYVDALADAIVYGFIREDADTLAPYGLATPSGRLELGRGGETTTRVSFGAKSGDKVHAVREGLDKVVLLEERLLEAFDWTQENLRALNLAFFVEDSVRAMRYETPDTSVVFHRAGTKWITAEADSTGLRSWEVNALLRKLTSTVFERILAEPLDPGDPRVAEPVVTITLEGSSGTAIDRVVIAASGTKERGASTTAGCLGALPAGTAEGIRAAFMRIGGRS